MHTTHNITTLLPGKRKNRPNYDVSITQKKRVKKTIKVESRSRWQKRLQTDWRPARGVRR